LRPLLSETWRGRRRDKHKGREMRELIDKERWMQRGYENEATMIIEMECDF
jgi:hypothetical protein